MPGFFIAKIKSWQKLPYSSGKCKPTDRLCSIVLVAVIYTERGRELPMTENQRVELLRRQLERIEHLKMIQAQIQREAVKTEKKLEDTLWH